MIQKLAVNEADPKVLGYHQLINLLNLILMNVFISFF